MSSSPKAKRQNPLTNAQLMPHPTHSQHLPNTTTPITTIPTQQTISLQQQHQQQVQQHALSADPHSSYSSQAAATSLTPGTSPFSLKRKMDLNSQLQAAASYSMTHESGVSALHNNDQGLETGPPVKKTRTNTPWTAEEERRLKELRDIGTSWSEIGKSFPNRTEGSVKKHWYKDMHYAEFTEEEKVMLFDAIRDYDSNKWKYIGNKVGKPAKACEQFAREHFNGK